METTRKWNIGTGGNICLEGDLHAPPRGSPFMIEPQENGTAILINLSTDTRTAFPDLDSAKVAYLLQM